MSKKDFRNGLIVGLSARGVVQSGHINPLNCTVTYRADNDVYEIVSVKRGNSVNAPATEPTDESGGFVGWTDKTGLKVSFPFAPTKNVVLKALFMLPREEITSRFAGNLLFGGTREGDVEKINDGIAVCGYCKRESTNAYFACFVGETEEAVQASNLKVQPTPITYNEKTYYYSCAYIADYSSKLNTKVCWYIGRYEDGYVDGQRFVCNEKAVKRLLDYYYRKIDG